ncbi:MAG TPA: integrase core domain-containing protein [Pirellulales bacterium]|nr:integrase core domain-containing protein [Pirellulales bacterium]
MGLINSIGAFVAAQLAAKIIPQTTASLPSAGDDLATEAGAPPRCSVDVAAENAALRKQLAEQAVEVLALKQQLAIYQRKHPHIRVWPRDRVFWTALSLLWGGWKSVLLVVKPETVVRWHRKGFKLFWKIRSTVPARGRPTIAGEIRELIVKMSIENVTWGAPRIRAELALLGHKLAERTVAKYMVRGDRPPSQTWRTFLNNHVGDIAACDFFVVPTATFRVLYVFFVLAHDRRRVLHFNVTTNPYEAWAAQQIVETFPNEPTKKYLIRDNDSTYGAAFRVRLKQIGIEDTPTAPRSPWQNPYAERMVGTFRRECLDHVIILNEAYLKRLLTAFVTYYHDSRTHMSLDCNSPNPREVEPPEKGDVISIPVLGGLHHRYTRQAA